MIGEYSNIDLEITLLAPSGYGGSVNGDDIFQPRPTKWQVWTGNGRPMNTAPAGAYNVLKLEAGMQAVGQSGENFTEELKMPLIK